jgi:hypothetical protein
LLFWISWFFLPKYERERDWGEVFFEKVVKKRKNVETWGVPHLSPRGRLSPTNGGVGPRSCCTVRKDASDPASGSRLILKSMISKERLFIIFEIKICTKLGSLRVEATLLLDVLGIGEDFTLLIGQLVGSRL